MSEVTIRETVDAAEYPRLVEIWRSAVDATHHFLDGRDRAEIEKHLAIDYFPSVRVRVADIDGEPVGFVGTSQGRIEMLFVDARRRGRGIGSALLAHVIKVDGATSVDVNEQNEQAVGFYTHSGFTIVGRSELDDEGRPYPLLHMKLSNKEYV